MKIELSERAKAFMNGICKNHTGKMQGMQSFSTSCTDNKYCKVYSKLPGSICSHCYAQRQLAYQHSTENKCIRNGAIVKDSIMTDDDIPIICAPLFRWESFGDVETVFQAANYIKISAANPGVQFGWFTKNAFIIDMAINLFHLEKPANLTIIGSSKYLNVYDSTFEKYWFVDHVFTVYSKDYTREHHIDISCGARCCATCQNCYCKAKKAPYRINELLK